MFVVVWQDLFKFVAKSAGIPKFTLTDALGIADTLFCEVIGKFSLSGSLAATSFTSRTSYLSNLTHCKRIGYFRRSLSKLQPVNSDGIDDKINRTIITMISALRVI